MSCLSQYRILAAMVWLTAFPASLFAQRSFGVLFDQESYKNLPLLKIGEKSKGIKGIDFPKKVSLRPFCPAPADQGASNTCSAFATGYGAMSLGAFLLDGVTDSLVKKEKAFSAAFVYNQLKPETDSACLEPISVEASLRLLKSRGNCFFREFDSVFACGVLPSDSLLRAASANQIKDFAAVFPLGAENATILNAFLELLRDSVPLIAVIQAYRDFVFPSPGEVVWRQKPGFTPDALHCLLVTGYDDESRCFEVMSSWGNGWADGGFYKVNYKDMAAITLAAYALYTQKPAYGLLESQKYPSEGGLPTLGALALTGQVDVLRISSGEPESGTPENMRYDSEREEYLRPGAVLPVGTLYQLMCTQVKTGHYVYVFSCDVSRQINVHFPKAFYSALFPGKQSVLTIPSTRSALVLSHPGPDRVCILISEREIPDFRERIQSMRVAETEDFPKQVRAAFSGILAKPADPERLQFDPASIKINAHLYPGEGHAVAVFLTLVSN